MTSKVDIGPKPIHYDHHFSTSPGSKWKRKGSTGAFITGHFIPTDVQ